MTVRVSANTKRVGRGGFGTLGSLIPAESFFFDDVISPTKYYRAEITRFPAGRLFAFNDGTFTYEGADSSFDYTVYKDGAAVGSFTVTLGEPAGNVLFSSFTSVNVSQSSLEATKQEQNTIFAAFSSSNLSQSQLSYAPVLAGSFSSINQSDSVSDFSVILTSSFLSSSDSFSQMIVYTEPAPSTPIDYGMSGFGHNPYWRDSIFFRGR